MSKNKSNKQNQEVKTVSEVIEKNMPQQMDKDGYLFLQWQSGEIKKWGKNGINEADLLRLCIERLKGFNQVKHKEELTQGVLRLQEGLMWIEKVEEELI